MKTANTFKEFSLLKIGEEFTTDHAPDKVLVVTEDDECLCKNCVFQETDICKKVACDHEETQNGGYSVRFVEKENK